MSYEQRRREGLLEMARDASISGGVTGGVLGGLSKILEGAKRARQIAPAALGGAALMGGVPGGSNILGNLLMGEPDQDDASPYTTRGIAGGLAAGGGLGAGLGALYGSGKLAALARRFPKLAGGAPDNLIIDAFKWAASPGGKAGTRRAAMLGGAGGGLMGAYTGADEGMQVDVIKAEADARRRRLLREALGDGLD
jgi:hypothetical protein